MERVITQSRTFHQITTENKNMSSRCKSCDKIMTAAEMNNDITLEDGTVVAEEFCNDCLNLYIYRGEWLDTRTYAFEHLTEGFGSSFTKYKE